MQRDLETVPIDHIECSYISIESPALKSTIVVPNEETSFSLPHSASPVPHYLDLTQPHLTKQSSPAQDTPHDQSSSPLVKALDKGTPSSPTATSSSGIFPSPKNKLDQEFSLLNLDIPNLEMERVCC